MVSTNASAVTGPTPGCVIKRTASSRRFASSNTARSNSAIGAVQLVEQLQKLLTPPAGPRTECKTSSSARPFLVNSFFLRHTPWLIARRATGCPPSFACLPACADATATGEVAFAGEGTQIFGKPSRARDPELARIALSVFCCRTALAGTFAESPIQSSLADSVSIRSNQ